MRLFQKELGINPQSLKKILIDILILYWRVAGKNISLFPKIRKSVSFSITSIIILYLTQLKEN